MVGRLVFFLFGFTTCSLPAEHNSSIKAGVEGGGVKTHLKVFNALPTFLPGATSHPPKPAGGVIIVKFHPPVEAGRLPTSHHPL
jgi:hypothetical protein